jgi:hypothetical protein
MNEVKPMNDKQICITFSPQFIQLSQLTFTNRKLFEDQVPIFQTYQSDLDEDDHVKIFPYFLLRNPEGANKEIFNLKSQNEIITHLLKKEEKDQLIALKDLMLEDDWTDDQTSIFDFMINQILNSLDFHFFHKNENDIQQVLINISLKYQNFIQKIKAKINAFKVEKKLNFETIMVDDVDAYISYCLYHLEKKQAYLFEDDFHQKSEKKRGFIFSFNHDHLIVSEYEILIQINAQNQIKYAKKRLKRMIVSDHGKQKIDELLSQLILHEFKYQYEYFISRLSEDEKNKIFHEIKKIWTYYLIDLKKSIKSFQSVDKTFEQKNLKLPISIKNQLNMVDDFIFKYAIAQIEVVYQLFFQSLFDYLSLEDFHKIATSDFVMLMGEELNLIDLKKILKQKLHQNQVLIVDENVLKMKYYQPNMGCALHALYEYSSTFLFDVLSEDFYASIKNDHLLAPVHQINQSDDLEDDERSESQSSVVIDRSLTSIHTEIVKPVAINIEDQYIKDKSSLNQSLDLFVLALENPKSNHDDQSSYDHQEALILFKKHFKKIEWILQSHLNDFSFLQNTIQHAHELLKSLEALEQFQQIHHTSQSSEVASIKSVGRPPQILLVDGDQLNAQQIVQIVKYARDRIGPIIQGIVAKNSWPNLIDYISGIEYRMAHRGADVADHILIREARRMNEDLSTDVVFTIASNDADLLKILQENRNRRYFWLPFTQAPEKLKEHLRYYQATLLPPFKHFEEQYKS